MKSIMTAATLVALSSLVTTIGCAGEEAPAPAPEAKPVAPPPPPPAPAAPPAENNEAGDNAAAPNTEGAVGVPATNGGVEAKAKLEAKKKAEAEAAANENQGEE